MSAIAEDDDPSLHFFNDEKYASDSIFGTGNIGPDRIRLSMANSINRRSMQFKGGLGQAVAAGAIEQPG